MVAPALPPDATQRAALLRFEALYDAWRVAHQAAVQAETRLWAETFRSPADEDHGALAAETARLRGIAQDAYDLVLAALRDFPQ